MNVTTVCRALSVLAFSIGVAGCSGHADAPQADAAATATTYAAVARGRVDIEGGVLALPMPRDGVLARVDVREGDHVAAGQALASLDDTAARLDIDAAVAHEAQAKAQLAGYTQRIDAARRRSRRLAAAAAAGAGDGQSADDAAETLAQLTAAQGTARAEWEQARQRVAAARYEKTRFVLHAPVAGTVTRVHTGPGAGVTVAAPLLVLLPDAPRIVRAEVNEAYADDVHVGMKADVTPEAGATSSMKATVIRVGSVVGPGTLEDDAQLRATSRTVECVLAFDAPSTSRVGQRVLVRFDRATTQK
ncbi:efflux RND transporter periplasmic adaptor subunit [Xanthomonas sp. NCPPB 2632]|uniref:efflux RND transporter periplasmic adaptor subunit n=1 Tax=Xanthomonas sp. NCPPB 2632 TaxID=3240912 RepID=UPI0035142725